jgi:UDP-glucose 4-epimerase
VFGTGRQTRDYIYVGDVVAGFLAAAESDAGGAFNIGTGIETDVLELGASLAAAAGVEFAPEMAPSRPGEVQRIAIDGGRANRELGWSAATDLQAGLKLTLDWAREADAAG